MIGTLNYTPLERELIIKCGSAGVEIALLEDKRLVELHKEDVENNFNVGDIYLGKVKKINPGMNAAFIDVGYKKDAFLHYTDLGPNIRSLVKYTNYALNGNTQYRHLENFKFEPEIVKTGKINNAISKKSPLLVQILKEPISTKGPRLTCEITLAGRYLVLAPFSNTIGVSKKISTLEERKRLFRLIESIRPKNFGVVIRTVAEGKGVAELHEDLQNLVKKWDEVSKKLVNATPPQIILSEINKTSSLLRDLLNESFSKVIVDDKAVAQEIKEFISRFAPGKTNIVSVHNNPKSPIFDAFGVTKQIKSAFGKNVTMDSGAYLIIEHTEALHVIDVNSGYKINNYTDQETNALNVNIESAEEIARQLRLRDLGGIITIDFIDMKNPANKKKVYQTMKNAMRNDRAKHTILPISKFGLMQITRQRVKPELNIVTSEVCPACLGTGNIEPSVLVIDEIERELENLVQKLHYKHLKLHVHPFIEAFLKKGFMSKQLMWFKKYNRWIKIYKNNDYQIVEYHFFDKNDEEIILEKREVEA